MNNWSYSRLKDFIGCPRRYYEISVVQNFLQPYTPALKYGNQVHTALENYVKDNKPLPANYVRYKGYADAIIEMDGEKFTEYKMGLLPDRTACDYNDNRRWVRGIADIIVLNNDIAHIVDYKTGSAKYPDTMQLKLMALMIFAHFPEITKIKAALFFIAHYVIVDESYNRNEIDGLWGHFEPHLARWEMAHEKNEWVPNPTALCKYCAVRTCEFNGG